MDDPDLLESDLDASVQFLVGSRFWIQKVLVPLTVLIGVCGNIITVMVLTRFSVFVRRRMRCTTTIYLTALAIADIMYLLFVLLLSFEKYDRIHEQRFELYWRFFGISHWICDAASSTSVWLTVSFTIERYIVVCHPIKGKVHCTEARAKNIITIVSILCLISTASTTFEYQLKVDEKCVVKKNCHDNATLTNTSIDSFADDNASSAVVDDYNPAQLAKVKRQMDISDEQTTKDDAYQQKIRGRDDCTSDDCLPLSESAVIFNSSDCCDVIYSIGTEPTSLANNDVYTTTFYWFSSIGFGLLPLVLIATFNSFLVHAVYRSQKQRRRLTNAAENSSQNNENRITLLLIGVVILFLICQTPTAVYLIYAAFHRAESDLVMNIEKGLGNIFNYLLTLNAACNFILYCVLSAKFRLTFRLVFCQRNGAQGRARGNNAALGASIIRHNRRHLADADSTTFENSSKQVLGGGGGGNRYSSTSNYASDACNETTCSMLSRRGNGKRFSHAAEQFSEEDEEGENAADNECNGNLVGGKKMAKNGQIVSANAKTMVKTPRNIETLSFNSIPRSRPMLMRPIGKARSTDLVV